MFIDINKQILGLNVFELSAILFIILLLAAFFIKAAVNKDIHFSSIDILMIAFSLWCLVSYSVYAEIANIRDVFKLIIPFITYIIVKNIIRKTEEYHRNIFIIIIGYTVPIVLSTLLIMQGKGLYEVNYWSGIPRFLGIYDNPHNMAHNMTFFIMLLGLYFILSKTSIPESNSASPDWAKYFFVIMGSLALYCLFKSTVRTSFIGLFIFIFTYLFLVNKKMLTAYIVVLVVAAIFMAPLLYSIFFDVVDVFEGDRSIDRMGSGRLFIWTHNISIFLSMPLDRQIAGVGIGNRVDALRFVPGSDNIWNSHNDYLEILIQTGIIGFIIFMAIQILFIRAILRVDGKIKYFFIAFFMAITFMNFASNSYITRFGLAQMFFVVMSYVELVNTRKVSGDKNILNNV